MHTSNLLQEMNSTVSIWKQKRFTHAHTHEQVTTYLGQKRQKRFLLSCINCLTFASFFVSFLHLQCQCGHMCTPNAVQRSHRYSYKNRFMYTLVLTNIFMKSIILSALLLLHDMEPWPFDEDGRGSSPPPVPSARADAAGPIAEKNQNELFYQVTHETAPPPSERITSTTDPLSCPYARKTLFPHVLLDSHRSLPRHVLPSSIETGCRLQIFVCYHSDF